MKLTALSAVVAVGVSVVVAAPLRGQGYNVRLDTRLQSVSLLDVNNEELAGTPLVSTLDAALWGFGIPGLSVRTRVRAVTDLRDSAAWPTTEPHLQLLEGYVDYTTNLLQAQAGRTHVVSRLGYTGFDGVRVDVRPGVAGLRATAFGGWGLARGTPLPLTTPEINPLSDFIPTERQILVGGGLGWSTGLFDANLAYQREVLPNGSEPAALASDRGAMDLVVRPARGWLVAGGAAYDFARREVNTADARVSYRDRRGKYGVSVGGRYYNPYFDLWTIWGVFNPTPYWSAFGSVQAYPVDGVQVWATGERYMYEDAEILQPIAEVDDGGWRWSAGTAITRFHPFVGGVPSI